ncbi:hypothetical protein WKH24_20750 [Pantoea agglomerans]|uniref:hypothetical protein n=1 Tax=Enterobacter agglomerans TaxID=549 RepID=UPI003C7D143D
MLDTCLLVKKQVVGKEGILSLTEEMPPVEAVSGENIRAGNLTTGSRYGHR